MIKAQEYCGDISVNVPHDEGYHKLDDAHLEHELQTTLREISGEYGFLIYDAGSLQRLRWILNERVLRGKGY